MLVASEDWSKSVEIGLSKATLHLDIAGAKSIQHRAATGVRLVEARRVAERILNLEPCRGSIR
jgi:hypothetical protein